MLQQVYIIGPSVLHPALTNSDVGKEVSIKGHAVEIGGEPRYVRWNDAWHHDCKGKIKSVEEKYKGKVQLEDEQEFENGADHSGDWIKLQQLQLPIPSSMQLKIFAVALDSMGQQVIRTRTHPFTQARMHARTSTLTQARNATQCTQTRTGGSGM